ncbi:hypothetical protein NVP2275O_238 [Vibrio phage 2.275.O._10N.286.54.E11]|nr:hypothetical protein NVP2275O_238 [Vibrio phage 2.275.O._10N.286.54.E11]
MTEKQLYILIKYISSRASYNSIVTTSFWGQTLFILSQHWQDINLGLGDIGEKLESPDNLIVLYKAWAATKCPSGYYL